MLKSWFSAGPLALTVWLFLSRPGYGQQLTVGFVGGVGLTKDFPLTEYTTPADTFGNPASWLQFKTGPKSSIAGASLEARISRRFSIEANVLRRPMTSVISMKTFPVSGPGTDSSYSDIQVKAWEFPVLLKHSFAPARWAGGARPFIEAGPSFRTQEDASGSEPSQFGLTAGLGAAWRFGNVSVAPMLRYTRWAPEHIWPKYVTKADQIELLATVAYHTDAETRRISGRRPRLGALAGFSVPSFVSPYGGGPKKSAYMAGISGELGLNERISVEADGIYKPLGSGFGPGDHFTVLTWNFPVLAKYRWTRTTWTPFVEAGPSFRLSGNLNGYNPSHFGVTAGVGMERQAGRLKISPTLRYTRWAKDPPQYAFAIPRDYPRTSANVVEALFGISF